MPWSTRFVSYRDMTTFLFTVSDEYRYDVFVWAADVSFGIGMYLSSRLKSSLHLSTSPLFFIRISLPTRTGFLQSSFIAPSPSPPYPCLFQAHALSTSLSTYARGNETYVTNRFAKLIHLYSCLFPCKNILKCISLYYLPMRIPYEKHCTCMLSHYLKLGEQVNKVQLKFVIYTYISACIINVRYKYLVPCYGCTYICTSWINT